LHLSANCVLCLFVSETVRLSPFERFNCLMEGLFDDVRTRATNPWIPPVAVEMVLLKLIWRRLRRMSRRFAAIMARYQAGTLVPVEAAPDSVPNRAAADPVVEDRPAGSPRPKGPSQRMGWVIYAVSWFVNVRHFELKEMLEDPAMVTQVAEAPELGGVLRPLCRMLMVKQPAWLRLPRKPRPVVEKFPPAPDYVLAEPGAELRPDGTVWLRMGASRFWKPGHSSWETLEEALKYDYPVKIWPR
jgi:hypothetical protein